MKKRVLLFLAACILSAICTAFLTSCGKESKADYDFKLNAATCRLSWTEESGVSYEVSEDKTNWIQLERARVNLLDVVTKETTTKIYVRSYSGNKKGAIAEYPITVSALGVPDKPTAYLNQTTYERGFKWNKVQGADQYQVRVTTDGVQGNWVNASGSNMHIITSGGEHKIQVRCKGFFENNVLMIPVRASEISESIFVYQAPVLRVPDIDCITWMSSVNFDSYKLSITDALGKVALYDNIVLDDVHIDLVKEGYITKTGEYDIQIIGVKNGEFYGSNIEKQFGTSNVNSHEIYSFDNRKYNTTQEQPGVMITDEQYYGKDDGLAGYSLKFDGTDPDLKGQMNLIQYATNSATETPVTDWRDITEISFMVYVPSAQKDKDGNDITIEYFPGDIIYPRFEAYNSSNDYNYATAGFTTRSFFYDYGGSFPTDDWVEFRIPCEIPYSNVLVMMNNFGWYGLVGYVDEIVYTESEDRSASYNAAAKTSEGEWIIAPADTKWVVTAGRTSLINVELNGYFDGRRTEINLGTELAGKTVDLEFKIKGSAKTPGTTPGFIICYEPNYLIEGQQNAPIDANGNGVEGEYLYHSVNFLNGQAHQTDEWIPYVVYDITIPENGIIWLDAFADWGVSHNYDVSMDYEVNIYIKEISCNFVDCDYQFVYSGNWFESETAKIVTDQTPGTELIATMQVKTSLDGTVTTNPYIGSYSSPVTSDNCFSNGGILDISASGWREISIIVYVNDDGDVYLGLGRYAEGDKIKVYIKNLTISEITPEYRAFNVLASTSSWSDSCYHGKKTSISASGDTLSLYVSTNYMNHAGLRLETSAISALNALKVKTISFEVTSSMGYVSFYNGSDTLYPNEYLTTTFAKTGTAYHDWFIASGTTVTIDISVLVSSAAFMAATGDASGIYVVMTSDTVWGSGNGEPGALSFFNIDFTFMTAEEIEELNEIKKYNAAFGVFASSSSWSDKCYFGEKGSISANGDTLSLNVKKNYTTQMGLRLETSAISALSELGVKTISFEVTSSMGYVSFYDGSETLYPNEYLTTTFANTGAEYHDWFIASGTTVTIDISVLAGNASFMACTGDNSGIYVVMTNGLSWAGTGTPSTLTLSDVVFTFVEE